MKIASTLNKLTGSSNSEQYKELIGAKTENSKLFYSPLLDRHLSLFGSL